MGAVWTSESVSGGHPDKLADQISDGILDAYLKKDKGSRTACETLVARSMVLISGEISSNAHVDHAAIAREIIKNSGYDSAAKGMDCRSCSYLTSVNSQSPDISRAVGESGLSQGAGDQGMMFGYAVDETEELMPLSISMAHKLVESLSQLRKKEGRGFLWPDAKSQVTVRCGGDGRAKDISAIVVSSQHDPDCSLSDLNDCIREELIKPAMPKKYITRETKIFVNPGGAFVTGGPMADCGLTGRKIIVDTYGGHGAHGGGAFSGKDPSKVDRSGSYAARHIAKNIVAAGLARKCLVQLAYAIGRAEPVSVHAEHFGTSDIPRESLVKMIRRFWDLRPGGIIQELDLLAPRYLPTAAYGHFGRKGEAFTWEKTNKAEELRCWAKPHKLKLPEPKDSGAV